MPLISESRANDRAVAAHWRRGRLLGILAAAFAVLFLAPAAHAADRLYWSNFGSVPGTESIAWANLDGNGGGGTVDTTGATVAGPMGLTLDPAHGRIYWANWDAHMGTTISYANLDGSGAGDLDITGATIAGPHGLAIDPTDGPAGTLYWPNHAMIGTSSIGWAQLDATGTGGAGGDLDTTGATLDEPRGMMVDSESQRLYWANFADGLGKTISYASLDGSGGGDLIPDIGADDEGPQGTAIDPTTRRIYWSDFGERHTIQSAKLDGTDITTLDAGEADEKGVHGVAIDPETSRIFWPYWYSNGIAGANLDGSGGGDFNVTGLAIDHPNLPSILKEPTATANPTIGGGADPGATLHCSTGRWAGDVIEALAYQAPQDLSYRWSLDGVDLPGSDSDTVTATDAGTYRCVVTATNAAGSTDATSSAHQVVKPPPPPPPPPSNKFSFGKLKLNRHHGTAKLAVELPGPGDVALNGKGLTAVSKHPQAAGEARLRIKPLGKTKRKLLRRGKASVRPKVTFTPTGGTANTLSEHVELVVKRRR
jgi:hypothetical protein